MQTDHLSDSHFSDAEQDVAMYLHDYPDMSYQDIADERGVAKGTVHNAVNRIRTKTRTSFQTLLASPFTEDIISELDESDLEDLIAMLESAHDNAD
jgi:predicted DNA-binding protein YlxM (UPF0122 family)